MLRFTAWAFWAYTAVPIVHFIPPELRCGSPLRRGLVANLGQWAAIAVLWIEVVIHLSLESVGPMKPRTRANEDAAVKPFRPEVAVGGAIMRSVVIVTIGAFGGDSSIEIDLS